jgi:Mg-chelatase subunit ChlD
MTEQTAQKDSPQPLFVSFILDESGSMQSCKRAAIAGFNQYVNSLKDEPAATWFTLTVFNAQRTEVRYRGVSVSTVPELDVETYRPQDTTPLYDAIGQTLMAAREEAPAEFQKLCVILTDGLENASTEYTRKQIFALIKTCEREGWRFVYLGADHDVWAAGEDLGIAA